MTNAGLMAGLGGVNAPTSIAGLGGSQTVSAVAAKIAADPAVTSTYVQKLAAPTGVAATDVAAINAAVAALPTTGGRIVMQKGPN